MVTISVLTRLNWVTSFMQPKMLPLCQTVCPFLGCILFMMRFLLWLLLHYNSLHYAIMKCLSCCMIAPVTTYFLTTNLDFCWLCACSRGIYAEPPNGPGFCPHEARLRSGIHIWLNQQVLHFSEVTCDMLWRTLNFLRAVILAYHFTTLFCLTESFVVGYYLAFKSNCCFFYICLVWLTKSMWFVRKYFYCSFLIKFMCTTVIETLFYMDSSVKSAF